jgi:hypothetical protein
MCQLNTPINEENCQLFREFMVRGASFLPVAEVYAIQKCHRLILGTEAWPPYASAAPIQQKPLRSTHERSSVGAYPSSAAPAEQHRLANLERIFLERGFCTKGKMALRLKRVRVLDREPCVRWGRPRADALRLKNWSVLCDGASVRWAQRTRYHTKARRLWAVQNLRFRSRYLLRSAVLLHQVHGFVG